MSFINIYSQTKKDLNEKIIKLINSKKKEKKYKNALEEWHNWFMLIYEDIEFPKLEKNEFFRAFYQSPSYFSIQVWKKSSIDEKFRIYSYTLYSNEFKIDYYEQDTKIISSKSDVKRITSSYIT